jgi:hypothetical protein
MRIILALLAVIILSGCCKSIPIIPPAIDCQISASLLKQCEPLGNIQEDVTYAGLIELELQDRQNLETCRIKHLALVEAINTCNEEIRRHNAKIKEINKSIKP